MKTRSTGDSPTGTLAEAASKSPMTPGIRRMPSRTSGSARTSSEPRPEHLGDRGDGLDLGEGRVRSVRVKDDKLLLLRVGHQHHSRVKRAILGSSRNIHSSGRQCRHDHARE